MRVVLAVSHIPISASLVDISNTGIGAIYYRARRDEPLISPGQSVRAGLRLPNGHLPLFFSGKIVRCSQIGNSTMMSIGIQFTPGEKQARQLKSYIQNRQAEILDELSNAVRIVLEPIQTKDLYF